MKAIIFALATVLSAHIFADAPKVPDNRVPIFHCVKIVDDSQGIYTVDSSGCVKR